MDDSIYFATISELAERLAKKEFSSKELTKAFQKRLETVGPRYNALAWLIQKPAIEQAEKADWYFKVDRVRTPLQGIPYGAKDLLATADAPTSWGAEPYRGQRFEQDATVIKKLASSGAVLIGKLAMVELAGGGGYRYAAASMHGPGRNPWNPQHWAGGSSSGSGAAVAAGLTPYAIGSETWGSILSPSSYCGVTGLRPTYGLVSRHGAMALSWTMDKLGPIAHSAEDCAIVLAAMSGKDAKDASTSGASFYNLAEYGRDLKELRVGFAEVDFDEWADEGSRPAFRAALEVLRAIGLEFKDFSLPEMPYGASAGTVIAAEGATVFEKLIRSDKFESLADEKQKAGLRAGLDLSASDYLNAMRLRSIVQQKMREAFIDVDMIVSPATADTAPRIDQPLDGRRSGRPEPENRGNRDLGAAGNLAGLPAICLPCGFAENGLPVAIQIVTRPNNELMLVAVGKEFQKRTDWHRRRPTV